MPHLADIDTDPRLRGAAAAPVRRRPRREPDDWLPGWPAWTAPRSGRRAPGAGEGRERGASGRAPAVARRPRGRPGPVRVYHVRDAHRRRLTRLYPAAATMAVAVALVLHGAVAG